MQYKLRFTATASSQLDELENNLAMEAQTKAVKKTLGLLSMNPRHPSLNTHKYSGFTGPNGEEVFEAYAQNRTPAAYRVFWCYGPGQSVITIIAITAHP